MPSPDRQRGRECKPRQAAAGKYPASQDAGIGQCSADVPASTTCESKKEGALNWLAAGHAGGGAATGKMHDSRGDRREHRKQKCKRLAGILREPSDISRFSGMAEGELKNVLSRAQPASSASPLTCLADLVEKPTADSHAEIRISGSDTCGLRYLLSDSC